MALLGACDLVGPRAAEAARRVTRHRRVRRFALLRRRGADARDLGPFGGRGPGGRHLGASSRTSCRSPSESSDRAVRDPAPRHRRCRHVLRPGVRALVRFARRSSVSGTSRRRPQILVPSIPRTRCASSTGHGMRRSSCWDRCCWPSPAPKRCTRTWATSASARSASPGSVSPRPRWCSITSGRARC